MACPPAMLMEPAAQSSDCEEGTSADPLCQKSCNDDPQKFETTSSVAIPSSLESSLLLVPPRPVVLVARARFPLLARANAPPLIVLFGRIRE